MVNKRDGEVNSDKKGGGDVFAVGQLLEMRWCAGSKFGSTKPAMGGSVAKGGGQSSVAKGGVCKGPRRGQVFEGKGHSPGGVHRKPGRRQYLVRWAGYDASHDTWEDEANVLDQELIQSFAAENDAAWRKAQREEKAERQAVAKQARVELVR